MRTKKRRTRKTRAQLNAQKRWSAIKRELRSGVEFHAAVARIDNRRSRPKTTGGFSTSRSKRGEFSKGFKEASEGVISMVSEPARKLIDAFKIARGLLRMKRAVEKEI